MSTAETTELAIFSESGYATALKIAETLVKSGILPRGVDNPFKAFAIIQKGREIGVGPMRALTGIALIEGKPTVSPELKLELFRQRGGRVKWLKSDNTIAHLWLKASNGDEHEEIVTIEDMQRAGVANKDNWKKYPKNMLRARATGFGLRALGEGDGSYTPDELGAVTDEDGNAPVDAEVVEPAYRATVREEGSRPLGDSKTTAVPSAPSAPTAASASKSGRTKGDYLPADQVPPKSPGKLATEEQQAEIAALKPKVWDDETYRKAVTAYKCVGGKRAEFAAHLQEHQADNLLRRMRAQQQRNDVRAKQMVEDLAPVVAELTGSLDDAFDQNFAIAADEDEWIGAELGCESRRDIPVEMHGEVILLLQARKLGTEPYQRELAKFKAKRRCVEACR